MFGWPRHHLTRRGFLQGSGAAAAGLTLTGLDGCGGPAAGLNFYNWDTYIGPTTLADFRAATGIGVKLSLYSTNDELFARLRNGNPGYDVIVPSNEYVERLVAADLLLPIDRRRLPNFRNIEPRFRDAVFDPGRRWSVPYTWLVIGIGYRKSKVDGVPDSWRWVFDSDRYKGRIALIAEGDDLCRLALTYLGRDMNTTDPRALDEVEALLIRQKRNITLFHQDNGQDLLLSGDVDLVIEYNGDIAQVHGEDADIGFTVPREGSQIASDCLCIARGAPHPERAAAFIDYLLGPQAGARIADAIRYPTPNAAAAALMPADYRDDPIIFPGRAALARCRYARYTGEAMARAYEETITRVRAA